MFPTQIIVTKELDMEKHIWLRALSEELEEHEIKKILENVLRLPGEEAEEFL